MPSNDTANAGAGGSKFVTKQISHDGDTAKLCGTFLMGIAGTEDSYTAAAIDGTAANGLEVDVTRVQGTVTVANGGTFAVQVDGDALTALQLIDDAVYTDATGTPSKGVAVMGTDGTNPQIIAVDTSGNVQVDLVTANVTNAGTFVVQVDGAALTALQLIDDPVAVLGTATYTEASTKGTIVGAVRNDTLAALAGTDNEIAPLQVNASGALYVEVSTSALPSGAATAANQTTGNTALAAIQAAVEGTLTVGSHAVTNAGTFAVQVNGDALTALQKIDNIAHSGQDVALVEHVPISGQLDDVATNTVTENQVAPVRITSSRALHVAQQGTVTVAGSGTFTVDGSGVTQPVSNAGTFAVQVDGAALTALQLIDDGVYTDDTSTHATGTSKGYGMMAVATPTDGSVDANDFGHVAMSTDRRMLVDAQIAGQDADVTIADGGNAITVDWNGTAPPIGAGTEAAALRVTVATDSTGVLSVDDGGGNLSVDWAGTVPPIGAGTEAAALRVTVATDSTGVLSVDDNGGSLTVDGTVAANVTPVASGGLSISRVISAATTNATSAKASAGQVYGYYVSNINASPRYLKLYNKASAPTVGTDTPVLTFLIPGNTAGVAGHVEFTNGIAFATGIAFALTTGVADADTGAVAANELVVNLLYK